LIIFYQSSYELHYYFYQRDMKFDSELKELAEEWQERIKTESYFDPETSDDAWLKYDEAVPDEVVELNPSAIDKLSQIVNLDENIKLMSKHKDQLQKDIMKMMGNSEQAIVGDYHVNWGMINYKAQPEKVVPAKEAYSVRRKSIRIKQVG
jgi:predicted phage-related endonuclease